MQKVVRDGKVAVVYGYNWFTSHGYEELVYHPEIVDLIEQNKMSKITEDLVAEILNMDKEDCPSIVGAIDLAIDWIDEGTTFTIQSREGEEFVIPYNEFRWLTV